MANRGEEKVRVHMNVVPRSTTNTNGGTELTLMCKLKCYVKPMKDTLGVSPSKGNQGTTRGKEKILLIIIIIIIIIISLFIQKDRSAKIAGFCWYKPVI